MRKENHPDRKRLPQKKGTAPNYYKPIMCLPMTWKTLTAQISADYSPRSRKDAARGPTVQESYYTTVNAF